MEANGKTSWRLTIKHPSGEPLVALVVDCEPANGVLPHAPNRTDGNVRPGPRPDASRGETDPKMTDPQRRFLFRLLAAQKVEGKQAESHLRDYFRVSNIGDITKAAASDYINQLTKDRKDAGA
jgi:hypothetical protein